MCPPFLSRLVSAHFRWPCSISILLFSMWLVYFCFPGSVPALLASALFPFPAFLFICLPGDFCTSPNRLLSGALSAFKECPPCCRTACPPSVRLVSLSLPSCWSLCPPSCWAPCPSCLPSVSFCLPSCLPCCPPSCWSLCPPCLPSFLYMCLLSPPLACNPSHLSPSCSALQSFTFVSQLWAACRLQSFTIVSRVRLCLAILNFTFVSQL